MGGTEFLGLGQKACYLFKTSDFYLTGRNPPVFPAADLSLGLGVWVAFFIEEWLRKQRMEDLASNRQSTGAQTPRVPSYLEQHWAPGPRSKVSQDHPAGACPNSKCLCHQEPESCHSSRIFTGPTLHYCGRFKGKA